jgi:hypothetical protein
MNVTREVVKDLLPLYFSGEASEDTRRLVEEYFRENPEFERIARSAATPLDSLRAAKAIPPEIEKEKRDLVRVQREVRRRRWHFGFALLFTLAPLLPRGHFVWQSRGGPWVTAFDWSLAALFWYFYFARLRERTSSRLFVGFMTLAAAVLFPLYFVFAGWPRFGSDRDGIVILWFAAILAAIVGWVGLLGYCKRRAADAERAARV